MTECIRRLRIKRVIDGFNREYMGCKDETCEMCVRYGECELSGVSDKLSKYLMTKGIGFLTKKSKEERLVERWGR